jgi:hypothetical protein
LRVGHELLLGADNGCIAVFDINTSSITHVDKFAGGADDMIAIDDTHYLLANCRGLLKFAKDQLINHYLKGKWATCLCHVIDSLYIVGLYRKDGDDGLILWNEQTDQVLAKICDGSLLSIKRVMTTNNYIIKTRYEGVKVVTINDLKLYKFSLKHMLDAFENFEIHTDCLHLQITNSDIIVATTLNEGDRFNVDLGFKNIIKLMKVPIAEI